MAILSGQSKVYVYGLQGEFQKAKQVSKSILWNITSHDCGYLMSSCHRTYTEGEDAYLLYAFDNDLNLKHKSQRVLPKQMPALPLLSSAMQSDGKQAYCCDVFTHSVYAYTCGKDSICPIVDIRFPTPVPNNVFADVMKFMAKQRTYDFIQEALVGNDNFLFCYACQGKYNLAVIDAKGNILKNGRYEGRFPKVFRGDGNTFLSPVSPGEYLSYWETLPIVHYKGHVSPESNFMIMKWTLK